MRERAVLLVQDRATDHASKWAAITFNASKIDQAPETAEAVAAVGRARLGTAERKDHGRGDRVKALEREVKELRHANEISRMASAYFAQAELDLGGT